MLVKFSTLAGGVFIEVTDALEYTGAERCFRFNERGNAEYAIHADLTSRNPAPRWFSHVYNEKDFIYA